MKTRALAIILVFFACLAAAQTTAPPQTPPPPPNTQAPQPKAQPETQSEPQPETKITKQQADELFRSVDEILQFASKDTGLAIKHPVKRQMADRDQVQKYITDRMKDDKDAKRLERSEVVLKKFGLVRRDFDLRSFLVELLKEQVAGFYDGKTKTVYLLDWVEPEQQKPVLAHELTHALQDQNFGLEEMQKQAKKNDPTGLAEDERLAALQAVTEGQAMLVLMDYMMAPMGGSVAQQPAIVDAMQAGLTASGPNMVVYNRAPMFLQQVLMFPYRYGTLFERDLLVADGKQKAYTDALKTPPQDTRQIMQPQTYLKDQLVPVIKPIDFDKLAHDYKKWDVSAMGEFDVDLLMTQYANADVAREVSPQWRGGYYWAALTPKAKNTTEKGAEQKPATADIAMAYVSHWATPEAAQRFATAYSDAVPKRYADAYKTNDAKNANQEKGAISADKATNKDGATTWQTTEGLVSVEARGDTVLVLESFDPDVATKLRDAAFTAK